MAEGEKDVFLFTLMNFLLPAKYYSRVFSPITMMWGRGQTFVIGKDVQNINAAVVVVCIYIYDENDAEFSAHVR